jgi:predicted nuclease with TOPRIM domain
LGFNCRYLLLQSLICREYFGNSVAALNTIKELKQTIQQMKDEKEIEKKQWEDEKIQLEDEKIQLEDELTSLFEDYEELSKSFTDLWENCDVQGIHISGLFVAQKINKFVLILDFRFLIY